MKLRAYQSDSLSDPLTFEAIAKLPTTSISQDWYAALCPPVSFSLLFTNQSLLFSVKVNKPAIFDASNQSKDFVAELWKLDCAELFLAENDSEKYQEINLAPQAAWWSASFKSYRELVQAEPELNAQTLSNISADSWQAAILVPLANLRVKPERANVTFVLCPEAESAASDLLYLSYTKFSKAEPDFHLAKEFPALEIVPLKIS